MHWIYYVLGAALALAAADVLVKTAAGQIPDSLGMLLYGSVPFVTGLFWFLSSKASATPVAPNGVASGLGVGVMFSAVTFCMYAAFRAGAPLSLASPLIRMGGLAVAAAAGIILWKEPVTLRYVAGFVMICAGICLIVAR